MKINIIAEGCYPYTVGGVSSWVQMLITHFTDHEFYISTILPDADSDSTSKYKLPPNVKALEKNYLYEKEYKGRAKRKIFSVTEKVAFRSLLRGTDVDWPVIFDFFENKKVSINSILMGEEFLEIVQEYYFEKYPQIVFSDFLWTMRSLYLPLFNVLKAPVGEADLYHSLSTGYAGILACKAAYLYKKPLLLTEHGIYTREREEEIIKADWSYEVFKDIWIHFFYTLSTCAYESADQVTALFEKAKGLQAEIGCQRSKIRVIPNGVQPELFENLTAKETHEGICIGAFLRVTPIKDVKTMIRAFAAARQQMSGLKLYIMGPVDENPEYYAECLEDIRNLSAEGIEFTGNIVTRDYLGHMDIVILTSISEGQPFALLEAMAAGIPCIATNVGDCANLLEGHYDGLGSAGIVVPIMDVEKTAAAILRLASDKELRSSMGKVGKERVKKRYLQEKFLAEYGDVYRSLYEKCGAELPVADS